MQRLQVTLPDTLPFRTEMDVRIGEVNYGGHLGNDSMLTLLQEARLRFLRRADFSETDAGGCGLIQMDAQIQYVSQAFYGDSLTVDVGILDSDRLGFELGYRVCAADGRDIARAKTGLIFFDYARNRPVRMPELFRQRLLTPTPSPNAPGA